MTVPPLPPENSQDWYGHYTALHQAASSGWVYDVGTDAYIQFTGRTFVGPHDPADKGVTDFGDADVWLNTAEPPAGPGLAPVFEPGMWSVPPHTARSTAAINVGGMIVVPFWVTRQATVDAIGCEVTTAAVGSTIELALFDGFDQAASKVAQAATVGGDTVTAWATAALPQPVELEPGLYGVSVLTLGAAPTLRVISAMPFAAPTPTPGGANPGARARAVGTTVAATPAALPALQAFATTPLVGLRAA